MGPYYRALRTPVGLLAGGPRCYPWNAPIPPIRYGSVLRRSGERRRLNIGPSKRNECGDPRGTPAGIATHGRCNAAAFFVPTKARPPKCRNVRRSKHRVIAPDHDRSLSPCPTPLSSPPSARRSASSAARSHRSQRRRSAVKRSASPSRAAASTLRRSTIRSSAKSSKPALVKRRIVR